MLAFHSARNTGCAGKWNLLRKEYRAPSIRWINQDTTKKIEALCYLSGNGSLFSNHVNQKPEFFIPSRNLILSRGYIYSAIKPSNSINVRMNEMENFEVETSLVPVSFSEEAVEEMLVLNKERQTLDHEIQKLKERFKEVDYKLQNKFHDFYSLVDEKALFAKSPSNSKKSGSGFML